MKVPEITYTIIIIAATVILFATYIIALIKSRTGSTDRRFVAPALTVFFLLCVYLVLNARGMEPANLGQSLLTLSLVAITGFYALSAYRQARASVKMAEEMREQRIMSSRPIIVQKDVHREHQTNGIIRESFSYFEIYNAGNSPTIRLEILLLDKEKRLLEKRTDPLFLRAAETVRYSPSSLVSHVGSTCYLLCQYQGVFSHGKGQIWYQTLLSFEPLKSQRGDIIIKPGELNFCEVSEKEDF